MTKLLYTMLIAALAIMAAQTLYAHDGATDANRCHYDHATGEYHCH